MAGKYAVAYKYIVEASKSSDNIGEKSILIHLATKEIIKSGIKEQKRDHIKSFNMLDSSQLEDKIFKEAIKLDALEFNAWILKTSIEIKRENFLEAAKASCIAVLINPSDISLFSGAIILLTHISVRSRIEYKVFLSVLVLGYLAHRDELWHKLEIELQEIGASKGLCSEIANLGDEIARAVTQANQEKFSVETPWGVTTLPWMPPTIITRLSMYHAEIIYGQNWS